MSNKTFIAIIVMILVIFAFIYVEAPPITSDSQARKEVSEYVEMKQKINFDDIDETVTSKETQKQQTSAQSHNANYSASETTQKSATVKKTVTFNPNTRESENEKPKKTFNLGDSKGNITATSDTVYIKVHWSNVEQKEKGGYTISVKTNTIITENIIMQNLLKKGYILTEITRGQENINRYAVEPIYSFDINVRESID